MAPQGGAQKWSAPRPWQARGAKGSNTMSLQPHAAQGQAPPPRPQVLVPYPTDPQHVPAEFRDLRHWVAWQMKLRDGKWTKPPVDPHTGWGGKCDDPSTWGTFSEALSWARTHKLDG